jgi:hypothetical protein
MFSWNEAPEFKEKETFKRGLSGDVIWCMKKYKVMGGFVSMDILGYLGFYKKREIQGLK